MSRIGYLALVVGACCVVVACSDAAGDTAHPGGLLGPDAGTDAAGAAGDASQAGDDTIYSGSTELDVTVPAEGRYT